MSHARALLAWSSGKDSGRSALRVAAALLLLLLCAMRAGAQTSEPPRRIASLSLTADEILVEIVPLERMVAATTAADDPEMSNVVGRIPPLSLASRRPTWRGFWPSRPS